MLPASVLPALPSRGAARPCARAAFYLWPLGLPRLTRRARDPPDVSTTVLCSTGVLTNGGNNTLICNQLSSVNTGTMVGSSSGSGGTASGNIDPLYGQFFTGSITTANSGYFTPAFVGTANNSVSLNGSAVVPQSGWGGGANVSLGPQTLATAGANVVWGVHSTPSTVGLTLAQQATVAAVQISWHMGDNTLNAAIPNGTPPPGQKSPAAFVPRGVAFAATISYGTSAGSLTSTATFNTSNMNCLQYFRPYSQAIAIGLALTYTSPYICHATVTGLTPTTGYQFTIAASTTVGGTTTTYATPSATLSPTATTYSFNTMIPPSTAAGPSTGYPFNWVLMADVGQTYNSSLTAQYIQVYDNTVLAGQGNLDMILNVADLTYADNHGPQTPNLPNTVLNAAGSYVSGVGGTNQQRWDSWFTMWQPVVGSTSIVHAAGNHELDLQTGITLSSVDGPSTYGYTTSNVQGQPNIPMQSWATRVPNGALPQASIGDIWSSAWFSQNLGPVHLIVLNNCA